jgi:hypothetical protein
MSVTDLIKTFSKWTTGPIDIMDHVVPEFVKLGVKDEMYFWADSKLDPKIIRGTIQHWEWPKSEDGPKVNCADITYAATMPHEWQRLVCCKEILHILDSELTRSSKYEQIENLIEKIVIPPDLQDPFTDGIHALTDRVAVHYAAAILFPLAARAIFLPKYEKHQLKVAEIAGRMEIPERYVRLVMSDQWPQIHDLMVNSK